MGGAEWECLDGHDCPSIKSAAIAEDATDVDALKKACETQLKRQGLDIGAFVVDGNRAHFKPCSREEALAAKEPKSSAKMYVVADPSASKPQRLLKAVAGEGMPTLKNPFVCGNLFLVLTIEFPDCLPLENQEALRQVLPPPLNTSMLNREDPAVEEHTLVDIDPYESQRTNAANMKIGGEAYNEDEEEGRFSTQSQGAQC